MSTKLACSVVPTVEICPNCKSEMTIREVTPILLADGFEDVTYRCKSCRSEMKRTFKRCSGAWELVSRLAADKPKYETAGGGAGEAVLAAGTPCAIWLAVPRHRDRADARSRCRATPYPAPPDRSPRAAWRSSCVTARSAGIGTRTAALDDAVDPVTVDFL